MNPSIALDNTKNPKEFQDFFAGQKAYNLAHRTPDLKERIADLKACIGCWLRTGKPSSML